MTASPNLLKSIVDRLDRVQAEIDDLRADKSEIYREARAAEIDVKALKEIERIRQNGETKWRERGEVVEQYLELLNKVGTNNATRAGIGGQAGVGGQAGGRAGEKPVEAPAPKTVELPPPAVADEPKPVIAAPPVAAPAFRGWPRSWPAAMPPRKPDGPPFDDLEIPAALRRTDAQVSP